MIRKFILITVFAVSSTISCFSQLTQMPAKPSGWVNDFESLFTAPQAQELTSLLVAFEKKTSNEIAIITIPSTFAGARKFDSLVIATANRWHVGKPAKQNGVVIGFSKGLQQIRISNGNGIRTKLTDGETKAIIDYIMLPYFRKNEFYQGTLEGLKAIMKELE